MLFFHFYEVFFAKKKTVENAFSNRATFNKLPLLAFYTFSDVTCIFFHFEFCVPNQWFPQLACFLVCPTSRDVKYLRMVVLSLPVA